MTAHERAHLDSEQETGYANVVRHHASELRHDGSTPLAVIRLVEMCAALQEQLDAALSRIAHLEAENEARKGGK